MSKSKKIGHFFTYVLKSVRDCKIERTGIGIGKARRMGRIAERVARTDAAHALRLVSAVSRERSNQKVLKSAASRVKASPSRCWRVKASNISRVVPP